ncbi:hypothetical protein ACWEWD_04580 [Streptomyces tendae]
MDARAHIIDWAWPTRGAAWIDPAILVLRLLEAGHRLVEADAFASRFSSWRTAPAEAKEAFAAANAAAWQEIARADPASWKAAMAGHAVNFHACTCTPCQKTGKAGTGTKPSLAVWQIPAQGMTKRSSDTCKLKVDSPGAAFRALSISGSTPRRKPLSFWSSQRRLPVQRRFARWERVVDETSPRR